MQGTDFTVLVLAHAHKKGIRQRPAIVALYKKNALRLEPEWPINDSSILAKHSSYNSYHNVKFVSEPRIRLGTKSFRFSGNKRLKDEANAHSTWQQIVTLTCVANRSQSPEILLLWILCYGSDIFLESNCITLPRLNIAQKLNAILSATNTKIITKIQTQ